MKKTSVGGKQIQLLDGKASAYFKAGAHGPKERGWFNFWTAVGEDKLGDWKTTGRARVSLPAHDRFSRMEREKEEAADAKARKAYAMMWRRMKTIQLIRPATEREIAGWIATHQEDAKHITKFLLGGKERTRIAKWPC